jgi:hypothetical protein
MWNIPRRLISPLMFCICLIPLTEQLNRLNTGYEELYMEDLKSLGKSEDETQKKRYKQLQPSVIICIRNFSLISVQKIIFKIGKLVHSQTLQHTEIQELEQGKTYKYLGIEKSDGI